MFTLIASSIGVGTTGSTHLLRSCLRGRELCVGFDRRQPPREVLVQCQNDQPLGTACNANNRELLVSELFSMVVLTHVDIIYTQNNVVFAHVDIFTIKATVQLRMTCAEVGMTLLNRYTCVFTIRTTVQLRIMYILCAEGYHDKFDSAHRSDPVYR